MAERRPSRLGPIWVWLIGLLIVAGGLVLLADWVSRNGADTLVGVAPGAEPAPRYRDHDIEGRRAAIAEVEHSSASVYLGALSPLGPAHTGTHVTFQGVAVAVLDDGLWLGTPEGEAVFVRVVDANGTIITEGSSLTGRGVVRHDPIRVRGWADDAGVSEAERTPKVEGYYIETTVNRIRGS